MTNREYEVLSLAATGRTAKQVALQLGITTSTVRGLIHKAGERLGVSGQTALAILMKDSGWLGAPPRRPNEPDPPLTHGQMLYLKAFDELLRERTREAEAAVTICFAAMCWEAGARPRRHPVDVDGWLESMARRLTARDVMVA